MVRPAQSRGGDRPAVAEGVTIPSAAMIFRRRRRSRKPSPPVIFNLGLKSRLVPDWHPNAAEQVDGLADRINTFMKRGG